MGTSLNLRLRRRLVALSAVMGFVVMAAGPASAADQLAEGGKVPALGATDGVVAAAPAAAAVNALFATAVPVSNEALGAESGKAQLQLDKVVITDQDLNGILQGNVANGTTNGNNTISGDAFSNAAGFNTAIQNTGNNVLIQDATIINISMAP